jgi:DNA-binding transcriptional ArsR family regulator
LRALAHPVRIALIEELGMGGALTATEIGERIGESPTTCSFHLRQLARYGFVEDAGGGHRRARPWRMTSEGMSIAAANDPEAEIAAAAVARLFRERQLARYRRWLETSAAYPRQWREAATYNEHLFYLTADELVQLNDELTAVLTSRLRERLTNPSLRPPGSAPVEMLVLSYPIAPPLSDGAGESPPPAGGAATDPPGPTS